MATDTMNQAGESWRAPLPNGTMRCGHRLLLEILAPPALGAGIFMIMILAGAFAGPKVQSTSGNSGQFIMLFLVLTGSSYIIGGIPTLIYAGIMEAAFAFGLRPGGWRSILLSTLLGGLASVLIVRFVGGGRWTPVGPPLFICLDGLLVGLITGLLIRRFSRPRAATQTLQTH